MVSRQNCWRALGTATTTHRGVHACSYSVILILRISCMHSVVSGNRRFL
jgi:hypothetical protein